MTFLSLFYKLLYNWIVRPQTALQSDRITVYLKKKKWDYDAGKNVVTAKAFLPKKYADRLETSVFNVQGLVEAAIWRLGHMWTVVNPFWYRTGENTVKARGDFLAEAVAKTGSLRLAVEPSPHPRHHNILDWPSDIEGQEMLALQLVVATTLRVCPKE